MKRISILAVLLIAGCGGGSSPTHGSTSSSAPTPSVPQPSTGPVVFIGDSVTMLWPVQDYVPGAINAGVNGDETVMMLARFKQDVLDKHPSAVVILGGTNDIRHGYPPDCGNLYTMAQQALANGARPIIATYKADDVGFQDRLRLYEPMLNKCIRDGAASIGYTLAELEPVLALPDGSLNDALFNDRLHPNKAGYDAIWTVLGPIVRSYVHQ